MASLPRSYDFSSHDQSVKIKLYWDNLIKYPECSLLKQIKYSFPMDILSDGSFKTQFTSKSLLLIEDFFRKNAWKNPHDYTNGRLIVVGNDFTFKQACELLGLPSDEIYIPDEEEDEEEYDLTYEEIKEMRADDRKDALRIKKEEEEEKRYEMMERMGDFMDNAASIEEGQRWLEIYE